MTVLFILVPLAGLMAGVAVAAFVWATHTGQFDDIETPPLRILLEEDTGDSAVPRDS